MIRRTTYRREKPNKHSATISTAEHTVQPTQTDIDHDLPSDDEIDNLNVLCGGDFDSDMDYDLQNELENLEKILMYARE